MNKSGKNEALSGPQSDSTAGRQGFCPKNRRVGGRSHPNDST